MESLYGIEQKLDILFAQIEDAEGEITEEQAKELEINETNLKEKLQSYVHYVDTLNSYLEGIKAKKTHLDIRKKTLENRIAGCKNIIFQAVEKYGLEGKNNKYIELDECRIFTKNASSSVIEEERVNAFNLCLIKIIKDEKQLPDNYEELLDKVNTLYSTYFEEQVADARPFTIDDIKDYRLTIKMEYTLNDLMTRINGIVKDIAEEQGTITNYVFENNLSKTDIKNLINTEHYITLGYIDNHNTVQVK